MVVTETVGSSAVGCPLKVSAKSWESKGGSSHFKTVSSSAPGGGGGGCQDCATPLSGQHPGERDRLYEQHGGGGLLVPWEGSLGLSVVSRG